MVRLLTFLWLFETAQAPHSTLTRSMPRAEFGPPTHPTNGFTVQFTAELKPPEGTQALLEIPGVLHVCVRQHDPLDRNRQNYPAFPLRDGSVPVLEASLALSSIEHPDWTNMTIGIPFGLLERPFGEHEVVLNFTGADWRLYVDGAMLDNDFPFGYPRWAETNVWSLPERHVKQAALHFPAIQPRRRSAPDPTSAPGIQYWVPAGHNNWVGDVATLFHQGRYHVFYLYDRRHHQSKFGCGAHYFEHLSTENFLTWTEHEAATPLEEQWECIGTGAPFVLNGQLCLSYGLHTTRVYPRERTALPAQWEHLKQHGRTGAFKRAETAGVPAGSTYAVSGDGVASFRKAHVLFHPCENPSVYTDPSGALRMMANYGSRGIWESESIDGGWRCLSPDFPPGGDCTFYFRWGRFDYIIGGFTGLWSKPAEAPDSAYADVVRLGRDLYDGLAVPSICGVGDGRFLMAGWVPVRGWGGFLAIRELLQFPDGRLGSKWMEEIVPRTQPWVSPPVTMGEALNVPGDASAFLLRFSVASAAAKRGRVGVVLLPENGEEAACELQIRLDEERAQYGSGSLRQFADRRKSLREGGAADTIENLLGVDRPFVVRMVVKGMDKLGGSVVDTEIAGQRTIISYRPDLRVKRLLLRAEDAAIAQVQVASLEE